MALPSRRYARTTLPNMAALNAALAPLFPPNQGLHLRQEGQQIVIEAGNWTGVTDSAVQAVVDGAPEDTPIVQAQVHIDELTLSEKALFLTFLDVVNQLRRNPVAVLPELTPAQLWTAAKNKAASLT